MFFIDTIAIALATVGATFGLAVMAYLPLVFRNASGSATTVRLIASAGAFVGPCYLVAVLSFLSADGPSQSLTRVEAAGLRASGVILNGDPSMIERGSQLVQQQNCRACHTILGQGGAVGPDLTKVSTRRTPEWVMSHFRDPQEVSPGTLMPKFNLSDQEYLALTEYLFSLSK